MPEPFPVRARRWWRHRGQTSTVDDATQWSDDVVSVVKAARDTRALSTIQKVNKQQW